MKNTATVVTTLVGLMLCGTAALATPVASTALFFVAGASLVGATAATILSTRRVFGRRGADPRVWLELAAVPIAGFWVLLAFLQTLTAAWWSARAMLTVDVMAAGAWATVATIAAAVGRAAAVTTERDQADAIDRRARVAAAARKALAVAAPPTPLRVRIAHVLASVADCPPALDADPIAVEDLETDLGRLREAIVAGDDEATEDLMARIERETATAR